MAEDSDLFHDALVKARVKKVWEAIFNSSNMVLADARRFGFLGMEVIPDPNIHQMLMSIRLLDSVLEILVADGLEYEETRLLLNARKQLTSLELVAEALKAGDRDGFEVAIKELETQAPF